MLWSGRSTVSTELRGKEGTIAAHIERVSREIIEHVWAVLERIYRGDPGGITAAVEEGEAAYRRAVAAEEAEAGQPALSADEAAYRRARRALREACERSRGLRLLLPFPFPLVRSLRERSARLRCQLASFGTACVGASVEVIERTLLVVATIAASLPVSAALVAPAPTFAGTLLRVPAASAPARTLPSPPKGSPPPATTLAAHVASPSLAPAAPGARAQAAVGRGDRRIGVGRRLSVEAAEHEVTIFDGELIWISCDPDSFSLRQSVCAAYDAAAPSER